MVNLSANKLSKTVTVRRKTKDKFIDLFHNVLMEGGRSIEVGLYCYNNKLFVRHQFSAHGMSPRNFIFVVNMLKVTTKLRLQENYERAYMSVHSNNKGQLSDRYWD